MKRTIFTLFTVALLQVLLLSMRSGTLFEKKYDSCSENKYQGNMLMIAQVKYQDAAILDCEVAVFDSKGECRASELSVAKENGLVYLTIQGEGEGEPLQFRVVYYSVDALEDVLVEETITFVNDAVVGSLEEPFVLNVSKPETVGKLETAGIEIRSSADGIVINADQRQMVSVYNVMGVCVFQQEVEGSQNIALPRGIYIAAGKKIIVK